MLVTFALRVSNLKSASNGHGHFFVYCFHSERAPLPNRQDLHAAIKKGAPLRVHPSSFNMCISFNLSTHQAEIVSCGRQRYIHLCTERTCITLLRRLRFDVQLGLVRAARSKALLERRLEGLRRFKLHRLS